MLSLTTLAVTISEADAYAASRGLAWTADEAGKTVALRRGQDAIAGRYNARWRVEFDDATAPDPVKFAIVEAAVRELAAPGSLSPDFTASQQVRREQVGSLAVEYAATSGASASQPAISTIDALLAGLVEPKSASVMLVRA